jgi:hypothetical protein
MFVKAFATLLTIAAAIGYFMTGSGYSRTVDASPDKVASALMSLDVRNAPGAPATDPSRSGDLPSNFAVTREGDDMVWTVTNGNDVAVRMIAHLEGKEGGAHTLVTARVERGNAPDDHVAPAFRSPGLTMGLFSIVLEDKLDRLVMPVGKWTEKCDQIMAGMENGSNFANVQDEPKSLSQAFARRAQDTMKLAALDKDLKAAGCPNNNEGPDSQRFR